MGYAQSQYRFDGGKPVPKFDTAESMFIERALLAVEEVAYNTLVPPLEGESFVSTKPAPPGSKFGAYRQYTRTGLARFITEHGGDLPNAGLFVTESAYQFFQVGASYQYNYIDLLAAALASENGGPPLNLDLELLFSVKEAIAKKLDLIIAFGSAAAPNGYSLENEVDVGMLGLLNQTNATIYTIASGSSGFTTWVGKTPDEVIADLTGIVASQISGTYKVHTPKAIIVPISQYETISGRSMGDGRSDTILSYFERTNAHIGPAKGGKGVASWLYCAGAGSGSTDRMVAYDPDPRYVRHMKSIEFQQMPPEIRNLTYKTLCFASTAGVVCSYVLSLSYGDGI